MRRSPAHDPMPSLSRKSGSRSRSPLQTKDFEEISIEDMMDDEFEKEENLKNAKDFKKNAEKCDSVGCWRL